MIFLANYNNKSTYRYDFLYERYKESDGCCHRISVHVITDTRRCPWYNRCNGKRVSLLYCTTGCRLPINMWVKEQDGCRDIKCPIHVFREHVAYTKCFMCPTITAGLLKNFNGYLSNAHQSIVYADVISIRFPLVVYFVTNMY